MQYFNPWEEGNTGGKPLQPFWLSGGHFPDSSAKGQNFFEWRRSEFREANVTGIYKAVYWSGRCTENGSTNLHRSVLQSLAKPICAYLEWNRIKLGKEKLLGKEWPESCKPNSFKSSHRIGNHFGSNWPERKTKSLGLWMWEEKKTYRQTLGKRNNSWVLTHGSRKNFK